MTNEKQEGVCEMNPGTIKQRKTPLFIGKRRERQSDVERTSKRKARQARLAKSVSLPRDAWLPIFADAVVQHRLSKQASGLLYVIYQECLQITQFIQGETKLVWAFDRPIRDLAAAGMSDGRSHDVGHLFICLDRLERIGLIRRLESRKGRPGVYEVLLPSSEDGV